MPIVGGLECRAVLETYHDLRAEHTGWGMGAAHPRGVLPPGCARAG